MDITVYLPDDVGKSAKAAELNLSAMLRAAVLSELERREAMEKATEGAEEIELDLEDENGNSYTGRFTGTQLVDGRRYDVYLTDDGRLIVHEPGGKYWEHDASDEEAVKEALSDFSQEETVEVMSTLGLRYVVDI